MSRIPTAAHIKIIAVAPGGLRKLGELQSDLLERRQSNSEAIMRIMTSPTTATDAAELSELLRGREQMQREIDTVLSHIAEATRRLQA